MVVLCLLVMPGVLGRASCWELGDVIPVLSVSEFLVSL